MTPPDPPIADQSVDLAGPGPGVPVARPVAWPDFTPPTTHDPMLLLELPRWKAVVDMVIFVALLVAADMTVGTILLIRDSAQADIRTAVVPAIVSRTLVTIALVIYLTKRHRLKAASVGFARDGAWLDILLGFALLPASFACFWGVVAVAMLVDSEWTLTRMMENTEQLQGLVPQMSPLASYLVALIIGLHEELVFRGFLMPRLRRFSGSWTIAVVLTTGGFAALHAIDQVWLVLVPITLLSLLFSITTILRRSIVPAIVGHTLFDFAMFVILYFNSSNLAQGGNGAA